ncbi:MAG: endonuclease/exonuclease/phosphatase family protein [Promethearchaeota archaeon]
MQQKYVIVSIPIHIYTKVLTAIFTTIIILIGCGGCDLGSLDSNPSPVNDSIEEIAIVNKDEIVVATYNILNGASVETLNDGNREWLKNNYPQYVDNRLQKVLDVINYINPDILGIEEAHQWELGEPSVVQDVADSLGMNYFFGQSTNPDAGFCSVALFTKFEIIESENYPDHFTRAGCRVKIKMPNGKLINVFLAHLDAKSQKTRISEAYFIVSDMEPFIDEFSIIMGDMNFVDPSTEANVFHEEGWKHPLRAKQVIDHIWTSPSLKPYVRSWGTVPSKLTMDASDHTPVIDIIGFPE